MGNNHSDHVDQILLGDSGDILIQKTRNIKGSKVENSWIVKYSLGTTRCELCFTIINCCTPDEQLSISIYDQETSPPSRYFVFHKYIKVKEDHLESKVASIDRSTSAVIFPDCTSNNPRAQGMAGVLNSTPIIYGRENEERKDLIVLLSAKREYERFPYIYTLKHYLLLSSQDMGLYVGAKIRKDNNECLRIKLERPVRQHKHNVLSLFNDVKRNGWWPKYSDFAFENSSLNPSSHEDNGEEVVPPIPIPGGYVMSGQQNMTGLINLGGNTNSNMNVYINVENLNFNNCNVHLKGRTRNSSRR